MACQSAGFIDAARTHIPGPAVSGLWLVDVPQLEHPWCAEPVLDDPLQPVLLAIRFGEWPSAAR
jgi:hypothetical protein